MKVIGQETRNVRKIRTFSGLVYLYDARLGCWTKILAHVRLLTFCPLRLGSSMDRFENACTPFS